ncbi:MAG: hypothetical protein KI790_06490 [Cyclobacteriaceae bacterium]|nr:hypothetical protein [Cyclobacteriaceae bacterium HetDA_MAG_MS6]
MRKFISIFAVLAIVSFAAPSCSEVAGLEEVIVDTEPSLGTEEDDDGLETPLGNG